MKITHSIDIACPPEAVWTWLDESDKMKLWMKGLIDDEPTSEGPTGVGSTFRMSIKEGRKVGEYDGEILVYDVNRRMKVRIQGGCMKEGMAMCADYTLSQLGGGGTHLEYLCTSEGELPFVWKLMTPIMGLFCKMQIKGFFRTLKSLAEQEGRAVPA